MRNVEMNEVPSKPKRCQWCSGACGSKNLRWTTHTDEFGIKVFCGWFSEQCQELSDCAFEAYEKDNT